MTQKALKPAVFLDRDGTLNEDPGYLSQPSQMKLLPHVGEGLALLRQSGYELIVISNQSGVGRGIFLETELKPIHARMNELLRPYGAEIHHFYYCVHHPDEDCECRKPKPLLIKKAAKDLGIDVSKSIMIGDKITDLEFAHNAGCRAAVLVLTGVGLEAQKNLKPKLSDFVAKDLFEAAKWIQQLPTP